MMGMCYVFAAFIPSFGDLTDPDYKQFFVSASESILSFLQNNKDLQSLYPYLEENLGFCGLYSSPARRRARSRRTPSFP